MLKISLETLLDRAVPINSFFLVCIFLLLHFFFFCTYIVSLLMIVLDKYSYRAYIIYSKSVKLLRLELYGNDIYTSIQAIIRRYIASQMIVLD